MKLIIVGIVLTVAIAAASFFGGYKFCEKTNKIDVVTLQSEHKMLASKLNDIDCKCDGIARIELLLRRFIPVQPFEADKK